MTEAKKKPGRPRKWSSDAERMRAARAAKREKQRAGEERRADRARAREQAKRAPSATPDPVEQARSESCALKAGDTWMAVHATCEANIGKLQEEVRRLEDEFDDSVYDRWILEHQYRMAVARMRDRDPEGPAWLDKQVRRWEDRREGTSKIGADFADRGARSDALDWAWAVLPSSTPARFPKALAGS